MNKFFRILALIFLSLAFLGSFTIMGAFIFYYGSKLDDFEAKMVSACGVTALLGLGSFLYHFKRLRRKVGRRKLNETETLLDDHLVTGDVQKQRTPLILKVSNILFGLWAIVPCIFSSERITVHYNNMGYLVFSSSLVIIFGYFFIYNIIGSLAHFIKHGK